MEPAAEPAPQPVVSAEAESAAQSLAERAADEPDAEARVALLSELATVQLEQLGDVNSAIRTLREALGHAPGDVAVMHQLASALLARASTADPQLARGDHRRVAELFYQIAQGVAETDALPYLESALQAMPDHEGALALLERLAPELGRGDLLPRYWVAYVASAGDGPDLDSRRVLLGQAYLQAGQAEEPRAAR